MLGSRLDLHEWFRRYLYTTMVAGASLVCAAALAASLAHAQVTTQVTGNGNTTVTTTANGVEITGGDRGAPDGPNLFHSFGLFNVGAGDTANFFNDSGVATTNIIGRVTDARSDIFGKIQTTGFGTANLWLLNPKGFVFGPDATLDVAGSFHASTADYIKFSDGNFYADPARGGSVLSVAPPSAFGFLTAPTGQIDVLAGAVDETTNPVTINGLLKVEGDPASAEAEGKTLSLVGGTVNIGGQVDLDGDGTPDVSGPGYILALGGHVNLVSVASSGVATFDPANINGATGGPVTGDPSTRDIDVSGFAGLGNINITQGSIVDAKEVSISGGQLVIDSAAVYPGGFFLYEALGDLTVGGLDHFQPPPDGGLVNVNVAGDVNIYGDTLVPVVNDLPGILSYAGLPFVEFPGDAPNILVHAGSLTVSGGRADIQAARFGPGKAADININADTVRIENGGKIESLNTYQGPGGSVTVKTGDLVIDRGGSAGFTGLSAQAFFHRAYLFVSADPTFYFADAGTITVNASNNVTLRNSGRISASSFAFGSGGGVTVNAKNLSLDNGSAITAESTLGGPAGNVEINASGQVNLTNLSQISSTTSGSGNGGNVVITAGQSTTVSSTSGIFASTVPPNQGLLDFFASNFRGLFGFAPDYATLQSFISDISGIPNPSIFDVLGVLRTIDLLDIPDSALIPGNGGAISLGEPLMITPLLTVNNGGAVSSSTGWDGNAGSIEANVGNLSIDGGAEIRSRSGLGDTAGVGDAGDIRLTAVDSIMLSNGGSISTQAVLGDGGNIKLTAPNIVQLTDSQITTSIFGQGAGKGGKINIDPQFVILSNSKIIANAFTGPGGSIQITAGNFILSGNNTVVQASSQFGVQGTVQVKSPENNVAGSIAQLPQSIVDVSGLLPESCAARHAGGPQSSFVVAGRGGLPTNPDNYLPSFGAGSAPIKSGSTTTPGTSLSELGYTKQTTIAMAGWGCLQ